MPTDRNLFAFLNRKSASPPTPKRYVWTIKDVVDTDFPATIQRTYLDHRLLRTICASLGKRWEYIADVGCGYGRNIPVLEEFAGQVFGFEREAHFREIAQALHPQSSVRDFPLVPPPGESTRFGFAVCYTFLQHMRDSDAQKIIDALKQVAAGGYVLLVEDTGGPGIPYDPRQGEEVLIYRPRQIECYQQWMAPFALVGTWPRPAEATYALPNWVGTAMLFHDEQQ